MPATPTVLSPEGITSYNGYTFSPAVHTTAFRARAVYDGSGRTIKYVTYTISIEDRVVQDLKNAADDLDKEIERIRKVLMKPAAELVFTDKGAGTASSLRVNGAGAVRDVKWGPKPQGFEWQPRGTRAARIAYTIEFSIPECDNARFENEILEWNYRVNTSIDKAGYTTRTVDGTITIAQTRQAPNANRVRWSADEQLENYVKDIRGFRKENVSWELSADRNTINYTVRYTQFPFVPPEWIVEVQFSHDIEIPGAALSNVLEKIGLSGSFEGTYEVVKGFSRMQALRWFLFQVGQRLENARKPGADIQAMFTDFRIREPNIWGRETASFSLRYRLFVSYARLPFFTKFLTDPVTSAWLDWQQSMVNLKVQTPRGFAQIRFEPGQDKLVDLCGPWGHFDLAGVAVADNSANLLAAAEEKERSEIMKFAANILQGHVPTPDVSWVKFDMEIEWSHTDETIDVKTLPIIPFEVGGKYAVVSQPARGAYPVKAGSGHTPFGEPLLAPGGMTAPLEPYAGLQNRSAHLPEVRNLPSCYITLTGSAARAGYDIKPPTVDYVGGIRVVPANRDGVEFIRRKILAVWSGVPIVGCAWRQRWLIPGCPVGATLPLPGNPLLRT